MSGWEFALAAGPWLVAAGAVGAWLFSRARASRLSLQANELSRSLEQHAQVRAGEMAWSQARYRELERLSPVAILHLQANGACMLANDRWDELAGIASAAARGETPRRLDWMQTVHPDDRRQVADGIAKLQSQGAALPEFRLRRADGRELWVLPKGRPRFGPLGEPLGVVLVLLDITDRKRLEQELLAAKEKAERANRAKTEFLAAVSHQVRSPLAAMTGATMALREGATGLPASAQPWIEMLQRNGDHLLAVVDDLVDLARIEAGLLKVDMAKAAVGEVVAEALALAEPHARERGIALHASLGGDAECWAWTDRARLRQLLLSLLLHRVKHGGAARLAVSLSANPESVEVTVSEPLAKLDDAALADLQAAASPGESMLAKMAGKTGVQQGMGMAISHGLARLLGAELKVLRAPDGAGVRFTMALPAAEAPPPAHAPPPAAETPTLAGKLLLLDEAPDIQLVMQMLLKPTGLRHHAAATGDEALAAVAAAAASGEPFDLVLVDMTSPSKEGYETARRLRQQGFPNVIVALAARVVEDERDLCFAVGCDDLVAKPISRRELLAVVAAHLRKRASAANPEAGK